MQKREHKRIIKRLSVRFGLSDPDMIGFTSDLSPAGMFIRTNRGFPPETPINIALEIPSGEVLFLRGIVKRAIKYSSHLGNVMKNGMGIRFKERNENYLRFLKEYYDS